MRALTPRERYTPRNAAQELLLLEPDCTPKELARVARGPLNGGYRWLSGEGTPEDPSRRLIHKRWPKAKPALWDLPPVGTPETPTAALRRSRVQKRARTILQGPPVIPAPASAVVPGQAQQVVPELPDNNPPVLPARAYTAAERHAETAVRLRGIEEQIDNAISSLSDYERITAHAGFRIMRAHLLEILSCDARLHGLALAALPEQDPEGAAAKLRGIRGDLEAMLAEQEKQAQHFLSLGAFPEANRIDAQARRIRQLLARARLSGGEMKHLLGLRAWHAVSQAAAHVLRTEREALEVCKEELAASAEPFAQAMAEVLRDTSAIVWPCAHYRKDILGFFRDILGIELKGKQAELALLIQENDWVACRSGHRVGKSLVLAGAALWFYSSFEYARVFITAPTERQLIEIDWRELRIRKARSGICAACVAKNKAGDGQRISAPCPHSAKIDGDLAEKPKGGLHSDDFRQVSGFTARDAEATAGLAGENIMFLVEEASGVLNSLFVAIKGNLAGGGRLVLFGNPTRNEGEFFDAFHTKQKVDGKGLYATLTVSSYDSPNVIAGKIVVPGLATLEWCEARAEEWGRDSAQFKIRVLGLHAKEEDHRLFSVHSVAEAEQRWQLEEFEDGPLYIGIDPAGERGLNDEAGFAPRRGKKILEVVARRSLDDDGILGEALALIAKHGEPGELATVNIDSEGIGAGTVARFQQYAVSNPGVLRVYGVRSSSAAMFEPHIYDRMRDELSAVFAKWLRQGGAIPADLKLSAEMVAHEMRMKLTANGERLKVTPKDAIKKVLKRSPDRYDACALSCIDQGVPEETAAATEPEPSGGRAQGGSLDPHAESQIDPYA